MANILTNTTSALEHYLEYKNSSDDFKRILTAKVTGATAVTSENVLSFSDAASLYGTGNKLFVCVSSITDIATPITVTLKDASTTSGTATVIAHAGIDTIYPITNADSFTIAAPAGVISISVTGGTANVKLELISIPDATWLKLGENFNESVAFQPGAMTAPVPRGWNATDHSKRIRVNNSWSVKQLYCSMAEGVAHLRGKTILLKDEIKTDGVTTKEIKYVVGCQVQNAAVEVGGGGGEAGVDSVTAGGYFTRQYTWTLDAKSLTA